jgi:NhaP-type Na+/H+ or K+/H+ antiporter
MSFLVWVALCGSLLLFIALASIYLRRLPVSTAIVYLAVGVGLGPAGVGWLHVDVGSAAPWLLRLTEIAVVVSLFIAGLKLRAPLRAPQWRAALLLAGPVMLASIASVALFAHLVLGFGVASALLLGAILAPTDPVLAGSIAVSDASDRDRMRYALSGEAGLNDGAAFPFVVLALLWHEHQGAGQWLAGWAAHRLLWAVPAALALGFFSGLLVGRFAIGLRNRHRDDTSPNDFLALALIALTYTAAEAVGSWGFLAAFAAGVGLRHAELRVVHDSPHPEAEDTATTPDGDVSHAPAEDFVPGAATDSDLEQPAVAAGVLVAETLSFGDTVERLLEVALIVLVGVSLFTHWDSRAVPLAFLLFFVARPVAALVFLRASPVNPRQRALVGWFGVRGIGSLYYLAYALVERRDLARADELTALVVTVVALSIVLHGVSTRPLLDRYEAFLKRTDAAV